MHIERAVRKSATGVVQVWQKQIQPEQVYRLVPCALSPHSYKNQKKRYAIKPSIIVTNVGQEME